MMKSAVHRLVDDFLSGNEHDGSSGTVGVLEEITADVLREVLVDRCASRPVHRELMSQGVPLRVNHPLGMYRTQDLAWAAGVLRLRHVKVTGDLVLDGLHRIRPFQLRDCEMSGLKIRHTEVHGSIELVSTSVAGGIDLTGARVGALRLSGCEVGGLPPGDTPTALRATGAQVDVEVELRDHCQLHGGLDIRDATVGSLHLDGLEIVAGQGDDEVGASRSIIGDRMSASGSVHILASDFGSGSLRFPGASIAGQLYLGGISGGTEENSLSLFLQNINVGGRIQITELSANGHARPTELGGSIQLVDAAASRLIVDNTIAAGLDATALALRGAAQIGPKVTLSGPVVMNDGAVGSFNLNGSVEPGEASGSAHAVSLMHLRSVADVRINSSRLSRHVNLTHGQIGGDLVIEAGSSIGSRPDGEAVKASFLDLDGEFRLDDVDLRGVIDVENSRLGKVRLIHGTLKAEGEPAVRASRAVVAGQVSIDSMFAVDGQVHMHDARAGQVKIDADLGLGLDQHAPDAHGAALDLDRAHVAGDLAIGGKIAGAVALSGTKVGGKLKLSARITGSDGEKNSLTAQGARVGGDLVAGETFFAKGGVILHGAVFHGHVRLRGSKFGANREGVSLGAREVHIGRDLELGDKSTVLTLSGGIELHDAEVGRLLLTNVRAEAIDRAGGRIEAVDAPGFHANGSVIIDHIRSKGRVLFQQIQARRFSCSGKVGDDKGRPSFDLSGAKIVNEVSLKNLTAEGRINLQRGRVGKLDLSELTVETSAELDHPEQLRTHTFSVDAREITVDGDLILDRLDTSHSVLLSGAHIGAMLQMEQLGQIDGRLWLIGSFAKVVNDGRL